MSKRLTVFVAVFAALLSVTLSVQADPVPLDYYWVGGEAGPDSNPNQNTKYLYFTTKNWRVGSQDGNQATVNMGSSGYAITCYILNDAINESQTSNPVFFDYGSLGPAVVTLNIGQEGNTNAATVQRTGGNLAIDSGKTINISDGGTLEYTPSNSGHKLTINSGGYLNLNDNGTLKAKSTTAIEIASGGTLTMSGGTLATNSMTINGTFTHTGGTLTSYDNTGMTLTGDYTLGSGATLKPNGTINVTGTANLNGTVDLSAYSSYVGKYGETLNFVTATTTGTPTIINAPNPNDWTVVSSATGISATYSGGAGNYYWIGSAGSNYYTGSNWSLNGTTVSDSFINMNAAGTDHAEAYNKDLYVLTGTVKVDYGTIGAKLLTVGNGVGGNTGTATMNRTGDWLIKAGIELNTGGTISVTGNATLTNYSDSIKAIVNINGGEFYVDNAFESNSGSSLTIDGGKFVFNKNNGNKTADSNKVTLKGNTTIKNGEFTVNTANSFRIIGTGQNALNIEKDGVLTVASTTPTYIGVSTPGEVNQKGGEAIFNGVFNMGWGSGTGTYNLYSGTIITTNEAGLWIPDSANTGNIFNVYGGVANFNNTSARNGQSFTIGLDGTSTEANKFNVYSGTVNAANIFAIQHGGTLNITADIPNNVFGSLPEELQSKPFGDGVLNAKQIEINSGGNLNMSSGTINLGSGGITNTSGAYTITLSGGTFGNNGASWETSLNATISSNAVTFAPEAGKSITWRGVMSGAGALTKTEAGTLELFGANSFEGGTTISNGQISLHANGSLGTGAIAIDTNGSLTFTGDMTPQPKTIANSISGTGTIVKQGASNFTANLDGNLTGFSGNMIISGGTLSVLMNGTNTALNVTNLSGSGNLELRLASGNGNTSLPNLTNNGFTGVISLVQSGGANGNKLDTGYKSFDDFTFNINSGTTIYVDEAAFGANVNLSGTGNNEGHGALRLHKNMTGNITVMANNSVLGIDRTAVTVSGNITSGADSGETTLVIKNVVDNNGSGTFTGVISDGTSGSKLGVQLSGGRHTFSGANTYTGMTTVSAGVLELTGDAVVANGPVTVDSTGTLVYEVGKDGNNQPITKKLSISEINKIVSTGEVIKTGDGTLQLYSEAQGLIDISSLTVSSGRVDLKGYMTGGITVDADGVFSPGNSVGEATFGGNYILKEGATLLIEQDSTGIDKLNVKSFKFQEDSISQNIELDITGIPYGAEYEIIKSTDLFTDDMLDEDYWLDHLKNELPEYMTLAIRNGNTVVLMIDRNQVPEPSTWALLILGAAGMLYWRKRKNNK